MVEKDQLSIPGLPIMRCTAHGDLSSMRWCNSADRRFPVFWPFNELRFHASESVPQTGEQPLYAANLPLYPTIATAITDYLDTRAYPGGPGDIFCLAPDYRGRIGDLRLSTRGLDAKIESLLGFDPADLLVKVHYQIAEDKFLTGDAVLTKSTARFRAKEFPSKAFLALLSRTTGERIDDLQFHGVWNWRDPRLRFDVPKQDAIENLASAGESQNLEFKEKFTTGFELAKAIVSFANTDGGRVLVGVTDEGEIVGVKFKSIRDHVEQVLHSHCDPPLRVSVDVVKVRDCQVAVISVRGDGDKPYSIRDKGVYIRAGASSRIASRYELDQIMAKKIDPIGRP
jgi:hypothetical protein